MKKTLGTMVAIMVLAILIGTFNTAKYATAGETDRDGRFIAYGNGTVLDTNTNLMWAAKDNGYDMYWQDAKRYCKNYRGGGYKDWRMPTMKEMDSLYNSGMSENHYYYLTKLIKLSSGRFWSSETRGNSADVYDFGSGLGLPQDKRIFTFRVLPVRFGK